MRTNYDFLFLSPHLDDVAMSCGGFVWQITAAGRTVLVATFFAGDEPQGALPPLAQKAHDLWGLHDNVMAARRNEDIHACSELGADYLHMDLIDCVYRRNPRSGAPLYPAQDDIFGPVHPADLDANIGELSRRLRLLPVAEHVLAPLGLVHVDHKLLRIAIEQSTVGSVSFYEDYPYCVGTKGNGPRHTRVYVRALTNEALEHKLRAILAYESQVGPVFSARKNVRERVTGYVRLIGGERLWHPIEVL